jgi:hypothetical protein
MQRRAFDRIISDLAFHSFGIDYFGTVTNISENGMFIRSQKISFPLESEFEIFIPMNEEMLSVPIKVKRIIKSNGYYDGIGAELSRPTPSYLNFINRLRSESENQN